MKNRVNEILTKTLSRCFEQGKLKETTLPNYVIEVPKNSEHGHFATNLPMILASSQKRNPREIASIILENLKNEAHFFEKTEIAGPGFINFTIRAEEWCHILDQMLQRHEDYGRSKMGCDEKILLEFVSANPTGPLHLGHGRGAALGDTLGRILSFCGHQVVREFYINDAGLQIKILGESIWARLKQKENPDFVFPENGYHGEYILDLANTLSGKTDLDPEDPDKAIDFLARTGSEIMLKEIQQALDRFRVNFDVWSCESDLFASGLLEKTLTSMQNEGHLYEHEGALWIKTSEFGDDKDRVIRKGDGQFTYFASDIAYHLEKHRRGFTRAINIWGADHHGYVPRVKAALISHAIPEEWFSVLLIQLVKLWQNGQELRMSKRAGNFVTLQELLDEVGVDAARFVFLTKSHDSPLDVDMDLVKKQDSDNPVYYVQYAHARICSIIRKAEAEGITVPEHHNGLSAYLTLKEELALIRTLSEFPLLLEDICKTLEAHHLTYYLTHVAASFHRYFNMGSKNGALRVVTEDKTLTQARLMLVSGVRIIIANGLKLLGVSAPKKM
ncbi:MAG: arginine--tRNA ligase [Deltaproteobacteria bacterium]|nr:arginine--tRNA ligase [Deltaproteobacteria bacterium]